MHREFSAKFADFSSRIVSFQRNSLTFHHAASPAERGRSVPPRTASQERSVDAGRHPPGKLGVAPTLNDESLQPIHIGPCVVATIAF